MDYSINSTFDQDHERLVVSVKGEIDIYNSESFKNALYGLLKENKCDLKIDCSELDYIDSTGLGVMVAILKTVKQNGNKMYLGNVKPGIMKIFKITDFDKIFIIESEGD